MLHKPSQILRAWLKQRGNQTLAREALDMEHQKVSRMTSGTRNISFDEGMVILAVMAQRDPQKAHEILTGERLSAGADPSIAMLPDVVEIMAAEEAAKISAEATPPPGFASDRAPQEATVERFEVQLSGRKATIRATVTSESIPVLQEKLASLAHLLAG